MATRTTNTLVILDSPLHSPTAQQHHMLPTAHIPVGISTQNCLAWSSDGELALAAGEEVYLLLPHHNDSQPWKHVRFQVNRFTVDEWPWPEPASFKDMSIGEEQALVTVSALAWSPCGLAKHRRSVLAVLTSNLLLSLWTSYTDPTDSESWERVMIVNHVLIPGKVSTPQKQSRTSQRIRSMAWAPVYPEHAERQTPFSNRKWGVFLMAITDDENGVYLVNFISPFTGPSMTWEIQTLLYKRFPLAAHSNQQPSLLHLKMSEKRFIDQVSFGTWNAGEYIPVTYHTSGTTYHDNLNLVLGPPLSATVEPVTGPIDNFQEDAVQQLRMTNYLSPPTLSPSIETQVQEQKKTYGAENRLGLHVLSRIWGFASFENFSAVCITLHPSRSVEYSGAAEEFANVIFDSAHPEKEKFPWQELTEVDELMARQTILGTILNGTTLRTFDLSSLDLKIIYSGICASMLTESLQQSQRIQLLSEIVHLLEINTGIDLEAEHMMLKSTNTTSHDARQQIVDAVRRTTELRGRTSFLSPSIRHLLDDCPICTEAEELKAICFESLTEAYCPKMHPFGNLLSYSLFALKLG